MGDITVTSADIQPGVGAHVRHFEAGAALTIGYAVYIDASGYAQHADANVDEASSRGLGLLISSQDGETTIASGAQCTVVFLGPVHGYASMTPGAPVYVSKTAGRIDHTKPTGGAYQRSIGSAISAGCVFVNPCNDDPSSV